MHALRITSPIGTLTISGNEQFICAVSFATGTSAGNGAPVPDLLHECAAQLHAYFQGTLKAFSIPLQQQGTPFQQDVWNSLLSIPYGKTASYLDIALKLRNPGAIRAVGAANGRNAIAIIVPCHRVIGHKGELTGYAGELWRKQWLLQHESDIAGGQQSLF